MTKSYEIIYFDARARAEPTRLALTAAGIKFTDTRISFDQWKDDKPKAPQGRLPYLVVCENGKEVDKISQSVSMLRFVGREYDMYPAEDHFQVAVLDQVLDTCVDTMEQWEKVVFAKEQKEEKMDVFNKETVPKFYDMLEKLLEKNKKSSFAVGDKLSIADCFLYNTIEACGEKPLDKYPKLKANRAAVKQNEKIAAYLKQRKQTDI